MMAATTPDTPGLLMYTSGTTGKSKGVLHGHQVLLGHHGVDHALDRIRPDDVSYSPVDWAWAGGLLLGCSSRSPTGSRSSHTGGPLRRAAEHRPDG